MPVLPAVPLKAQPTSPDSADVLLLQQVKLLYAGLPVSQAVTLLNGVVLAAVQSVVIEPPRVIAWLAALMVVAVVRIVLGNLFRRACPSSDETTPHCQGLSRSAFPHEVQRVEADNRPDGRYTQLT